HADLARRAGGLHAPGLHEVVEGDDLGLDEAALEVGVDLPGGLGGRGALGDRPGPALLRARGEVGLEAQRGEADAGEPVEARLGLAGGDRKSTRLNSSHVKISYAVFCSKKKRTA